MNRPNVSPLLRAIALLLALVMLMTGCTSVTTVPLPPSSHETPPFRAGDRVRVQTIDGRRLEFSVTRVDPQGLSGSSVRVEYREMRSIQIRRMAKAKTAAAAAGVLLGAALVITIVVVASGGFAMMPSGPY